MSPHTRRPVRLLYQMTTAKQKTDLGMAEVERRHAFLRTQVEPATTVDIAVPSRGPGSIESRYDSAMAVPLLLEAVMKAEADGYDAVVISCFGDPGLDACREIVSIPIVSSGQASMHVAAQLGSRFSIISPKEGAGSRVLENPRKYGFILNYASTRGAGLSVLDLARDRQRTLDRLAEVGARAVAEDGADTLILGCMSMAFHDISGELQDRIGVPVVNPVPASLALAELLVRANLRQSRKAYPKPDKLEIL
jgi:allantoin racemase